MWALVKATAAAVYARYPQALEEDVELLRKHDANEEGHVLTYNQRNCVLYRMGEKEILAFWIDAADSMSKWLATPVKTASAELK
jgi:protein-histidine N-methyltransferase